MLKYRFEEGTSYRDYGYLDVDERYDYVFTSMPWSLGTYTNNINTGITVEKRYDNLSGELDYLVTTKDGYLAECYTLDDVIRILDKLIGRPN